MHRQFVVSAFTKDWRAGNPAAVCLLDHWISEADLQSIAAQNNLSETAFMLWPEHADECPDLVDLRWFTPTTEVDLCGHATLASAHVLYTHCGVRGDQRLCFETRSGQLNAWQVADSTDEDRLVIELPATEPIPVSRSFNWLDALGLEVMPSAVLAGEDYLLVFESEKQVVNAKPNMRLLSELDRRGVIITALASVERDEDFVSRFFVPKLGVDEDPVTGSAHTQLIPYWSTVLGHRRLLGWQASERGGRVYGQWSAPKVVMEGEAVTFCSGHLDVANH